MQFTEGDATCPHNDPEQPLNETFEDKNEMLIVQPIAGSTGLVDQTDDVCNAKDEADAEQMLDVIEN